MANSNFNIKSACTFLWKIENFNYMWRGAIESQEFVVEVLENTWWQMELYPRTNSPIGFYLKRIEDSSSADGIDVYFELAFLSENGSTLCSRQHKKHKFCKGSREGYKCFVNQEEVFVVNKSMYLPLNTLTARCKIWRCDGKAAVDKYFLQESRVLTRCRSFQWQIEKFSTFEVGERSNLVISSLVDKLIAFDLYLTTGSICEEVITVDIHIFEPHPNYVFFKTSILDTHGNFINSGIKEFFMDGYEKKGTFTLPFTKKQLMKEENYLNNDVLTLYCVCNFSTGILSKPIETIDCAQTGVAVLQNESSCSTDDAESLRQDLGFLYNCDVLSDIGLRTTGSVIPIHTQVLGARSSVFRTTFDKYLGLKIEGCIDAPDLDENTLRRMLLYMYTDKVEDLQWEEATRLYVAADKYDIASLKRKCGAILKAQLSQNNVCQTLRLAKKNQDEDLKQDVINYILILGETIFSSREWKLLMKNDLQLAAEVMYQNCTKIFL